MALQSARFARTDDWQFQKPLYWATVEDGSQIVGCAFRTPPHRLGITALPLDAIPKLVESVGAIYRTLSGVAGPEPPAKAFTAAWLRQRGGSSLVRSRQRLLEHKAIVPIPNSPRGTLRLATAADAGAAQQWGSAFARESGLTMLDGGVCARLIPDRRLYFWDDGAPRCMLGVLRETSDAAAIGILYTPPTLRERGYATASVVAFSQHLLDRGLTTLVLLSRSCGCGGLFDLLEARLWRRTGHGGHRLRLRVTRTRMNKPTIYPLFAAPVYVNNVGNFERPDLKSLEYSSTIPTGGAYNFLSSVDKKVLDRPEFRHVHESRHAGSQRIREGASACNRKIEFYVTDSWVNVHRRGQSAGPHVHHNSLISGVLYLQVTETTGDLVFHRDVLSLIPFPPALDLDMDSFNLYNCKSWSYKPKTNDICLFPSVVMHSADPNDSDEERWCLAFNVFVRGDIGSLHKLHIK